MSETEWQHVVAMGFCSGGKRDELSACK